MCETMKTSNKGNAVRTLLILGVVVVEFLLVSGGIGARNCLAQVGEFHRIEIIDSSPQMLLEPTSGQKSWFTKFPDKLLYNSSGGTGNFVIALTMFYSIREFGLIISIVVLLFFVATFLLMFFGLNKSYNSKRNKVRLRRFLFSISRLFSSDTTSKKLRIKRLAFNQKLKRIRILFF